MCNEVAEQSNVKLYSLYSLYEMQKPVQEDEIPNSMHKDGEYIGIPAVQRGLVWEPSKIVNLWDSIVKGYPIGIFQCYEEKQGEKVIKCLIDGQQRLNAICLGYENSEEASLWVATEEDPEKPIFMVCTRRHPWGYKREILSDGVKLNAFSAAKRDLQNQLLKSDKEQEDIFQIADLKDGHPLADYQGLSYCPLPAILTSNHAPAGFEKIWNSNWATRFRDRGNKIIPMVTIPNFEPTPSKLREVFSRINRGGSTLKPRDELYSAICVYGEDREENFSIKTENKKLCQHFLPAERMTKIAARIAQSEYHHDSKLTWKYSVDVSAEKICTWFSQKGEGAGRKLIDLYKDDNSLQKIKGIFIKCLGDDEDDRVPSYIYLSDDSDNWLYVIFSMIRKAPSIFEKEDRHFALLCLLPYITCGTNATHGLNNFCEGFYNFAMNYEAKDLLDLMAKGMVGASFNHAFTWPYPHEIDNFVEKKDATDYSTYWLDIFRKHYGRVDNNILYYYQRAYVNQMLKSGYDPARPSTWEGSNNKPWDIDHVIPDSWWPEDTENVRNEIGNMQVMYFRHNRMKNDSYAGAYNPDDTAKDKLNYKQADERIKQYFHYEQEDYNEINNSAEKPNINIFRHLVRRRQESIIKAVCKDLKLLDLINKLENFDTEGNSLFKAAKKRYNVFKTLSTKIAGENSDSIKWGICTYDWRRQKKNVDDVTWVHLNNPTFYSTLTNWLILGKSEYFGSIEVLWSVQAEIKNTSTISYHVAFSRPIGVSTQEWMRLCKEAKWPTVDAWIAKVDSEYTVPIEMKVDIPVDIKEEGHIKTIEEMLNKIRDNAKKLSLLK